MSGNLTMNQEINLLKIKLNGLVCLLTNLANPVNGKSAYQLAVELNNFQGTEAQWLASLKGATGPAGPMGPTGYKTINPTFITPSTPTPTTNGEYKPAITSKDNIGTDPVNYGTLYSNIGPTIRAKEGYDTFFVLTNGTWTKYETKIDVPIVSPTFNKTTTSSPQGGKQIYDYLEEQKNGITNTDVIVTWNDGEPLPNGSTTPNPGLFYSSFIKVNAGDRLFGTLHAWGNYPIVQLYGQQTEASFISNVLLGLASGYQPNPFNITFTQAGYVRLSSANPGLGANLTIIKGDFLPEIVTTNKLTETKNALLTAIELPVITPDIFYTSTDKRCIGNILQVGQVQFMTNFFNAGRIKRFLTIEINRSVNAGTAYIILQNNVGAALKEIQTTESKISVDLDIGNIKPNLVTIRVEHILGTGGSTIQIKNIYLTDIKDFKIKNIEVPVVETVFDGKDKGYSVFRVGNRMFSGKENQVIRRDNDITEGGYSDYSQYDYDGKKQSFKTVKNDIAVDLKGTYSSPSEAGRYLLTMDKQGFMYFINNNTIEKIHSNAFISSLTNHDFTGTNVNNVTFTTTAAEANKTAEFNKLKSKMKMVSSLTPVQTFVAGNIYSRVGIVFDNGTLYAGDFVYRKDGTSSRAVLKNPIVGNPYRIVVKNTSNVVVYDGLLKGKETSAIRWGKLESDSFGNIEAAINFVNGKTFNIPAVLLAGSYTVELYTRRYGTTLVDGTVTISGTGVGGSITMTGKSGVSASGEVVIRSGNLVVSSNITQFTLTANCATEKPFETGNNGDQPNWGTTVEGKYGCVIEYGAAPLRKNGKCYFTQDNGETWEDLFDVSLNEIFYGTSDHHIHGARYDKYWKQLIILGGDAPANRILHHANIDSTSNINTINFTFVPGSTSANEVKFGAGEQYCSVFPAQRSIMFGTDFIVSGVWSMPRLEYRKITTRHPSYVIADYTITHIPSSWFHNIESDEIFTLCMGGDQMMQAPEAYRTSVLLSTSDEVQWKEVWKDNIINTQFGANQFNFVAEYNGKLFINIYQDGRFQNNHSLIIADYN